MIDYVYRFEPANPATKRPPADAEQARQMLEEGNRTFARWIASCQSGAAPGAETPYVIHCNANEVGLVRKAGGMPRQAPFAAVLSCSDARVPTEMIFGQGFNNLFVIRVAGNVLGDVCMGSVDFAVTALSESVKVVVVLGHVGCGAVSAAVESYLRPLKVWSKATTPALREIQEKLFLAVRASANGIKEVWGGAEARHQPGFREALVESAVCVNAAMVAFDVRQTIERTRAWDIEVLYGVFNLYNHQVMALPLHPRAASAEGDVRLAYAPTNPREFHTLAVRLAQLLRPLGERGAEPPPADAAAP
jgi:carbonic anhydrase